jgi:hypothetical protein
MTKSAAKPLAAKKRVARRNAAARATNGLPVLKLPLEGKIKRADIRRAVRAVLKEKAEARSRASTSS